LKKKPVTVVKSPLFWIFVLNFMFFRDFAKWLPFLVIMGQPTASRGVRNPLEMIRGQWLPSDKYVFFARKSCGYCL
jgi:hypothetical protein